ncbi:hypothetical protein C8F01DRAFT_1051853 [Mycena amicta]|nr:hypothetical protein C8F01DRAFT_1051853 [Mycena amicta]
MSFVDILIFGAGWTSTFLIPLCQESNITFASTTRSGAASTIKFDFQPNSEDAEPYKALPDARTVLITFPITVSGASERLVRLYLATRSESTRMTQENKPFFIQLGATSIWDKLPSVAAKSAIYDRNSPFTPTGRSNAEVELLTLSPTVASTTVLNLAGLWGGQRVPRNWVGRVAPTKEALQMKGSVHFLHGQDLARAILAVHNDFEKAAGQRWLLTDGRVYDWWDLASAWTAGLAPPADAPSTWVCELMREDDVKVLPRNTSSLGRVLDSRDFWNVFGLAPIKARVE